MKRIIILILIISCAGTTGAQDLQSVMEKSSNALKLDVRKRFSNLNTSGYFIMTGSEARIPFDLLQAKPDKLRIETTVFGFRAIQTYDGTTAWSLNPTQGMEAVKTDVRDMEFIAAATAIDGPYSVNKNNKYVLEYQGSDLYQEKPVEIISWTSDSERLKYYISSESWLVDGVRYEYRKNGGWYSMEYRIKSYTEFMGSRFPGELAAVVNGVEMGSLFITSVKVLEKPDIKKFGKPTFTM